MSGEGEGRAGGGDGGADQSSEQPCPANAGPSGAKLIRVAEADDAGAAVGADDRSDKADAVDFDSHQFEEGVDVGGQAVAYGDVGGVGGHLVGQPCECLLAGALATGFFNRPGAQVDARLDR